VGWTASSLATTYVLEGAIYSTGSTLRWFRDALDLFDTYEDLDDLLATTTSSGGVTFLPLFEGLGSPYMDPDPRGAITGLSPSTKRSEILYAAIEAMAHQGTDVIDAMEQAQGHRMTNLRVDGGVSVMNKLCQMQADFANIQVDRSKIVESTAFGVAGAAMVTAGVLESLDDLKQINPLLDHFEPSPSRAGVKARRSLWRDRLTRVRAAAH
jgi:glycerol kinase